MVKYSMMIFVLFSSIFIISCNVDFSKNEVKKTNISGLITRKYLDEWNHEEPTIIIGKEKEFKYQMSAWRRNSDLWDYLQTGDSIIKPSGTLTLKIIKPNGEFKEYEYQR